MSQAGRDVDDPEVAVQIAHVLDWFWDLSWGRGSNGYGPNPITYLEIGAWKRETGARPSAWEMLALRAMDTAFISAS